MKNLKTFEELEIADKTTRENIEAYIEHADYDEPQVYHQGEYTNASEWAIDWKGEIKFDESWNMYLPSYTVKNFVDNSYSDESTGHNLVSDVTYDVDTEYSQTPSATLQEIQEWNQTNS